MPRVALVVDDSMLIRHTVCRFLEERGFTVESATNGVQALEMLGDLSPDIIITDMQMPKMDGSQLIDELKAKPETAKIPIVILAGKQTGADHAHEARADYVIFKDIDIDHQLQKALVAALGDPAIAGL
ncbi:MAG TPA: response regulator [Terriglobales bacterium]|nr:response regulator [Terriglobales bacterium]